MSHLKKVNNAKKKQTDLINGVLDGVGTVAHIYNSCSHSVTYF